MDAPARVVLVTGAAGGIGRALVAEFGGRGDRVVAVDRDAQRLGQLAVAFPSAVVVAADISSTNGADAAIAACEGRLDVLVNNAAAFDGMAQLDEVTEADWERVLAVNLTGPFRLCRRALPLMLAAGARVMINIASVAGLRGARGGAAYSASKAGLISLTEHIAGNFADRGIRCNAICPGAVATEILGTAEISDRGRAVLARDRFATAPGTPEEIAAVAGFLAGDAASRINGVALAVDGGALAY